MPDARDAAEPVIHRGLQDILIDKTYISDLRTDDFGLLYRGYPIAAVLETLTYESVVYLLLQGSPPDAEAACTFRDRLAAYRELPDFAVAILDQLQDASPLVALRTVVSALAATANATDATPKNATPKDANEAFVDQTTRLLAQSAAAIATHHAHRQGRSLPNYDPTLGHAANFLYQITGQRPSEDEALIIDQCFILLAEHGSNASTFAGRVAASTGADLHAAITAALGTLGGSLHGGAMGEVIDMLNAIDYSQDVLTQLKARRKQQKRISGFGHRIYKTIDPRAPFLRIHARALSQSKGSDLFEKAEVVEAAMAPYRRRGVNVNVDFYLSIIYHLLGIPTDMITLTAGLSRMVGWAAHILEQTQNNVLIRPSMRYAGDIVQDWPAAQSTAQSAALPSVTR
ncbi:MAG: citrate/2-methylcitrate synthase [Elainellaceae cyanobacterium]